MSKAEELRSHARRTASKGHQQMTTITTLKAWMRAATPDEQTLLAERAGTSRAYLYHLSASDATNYSREPRPKLAAAIERETLAMAKASKGRLPVVYRTDLVQACRECAFAQKCLGEKAVASHFPIVTGPDLADSEGGHAD